MLKALHHNVPGLLILPKCTLVLVSPGVFYKVCPEELYYGTVKTERILHILYKSTSSLLNKQSDKV